MSHELFRLHFKIGYLTAALEQLGTQGLAFARGFHGQIEDLDMLGRNILERLKLADEEFCKKQELKCSQ